MLTSATLAPLPSTTEFVARVEERETIPTLDRRSSGIRPTASLIPMQRSSWVVGALALQRSLDSSRSMTTASVNVPPVSKPNPIFMADHPYGTTDRDARPSSWRKQNAFAASAPRGDETEAFIAGRDHGAHMIGQSPLLDLSEYVVGHPYRELAVAFRASNLGAPECSLGASLTRYRPRIHQREYESASGACEVLPDRCSGVVGEPLPSHRLEVSARHDLSRL